ncbi:hypothetical protein N9060_02120, partial [Arenicella sp.]|nr:hypothetical protein [Arenicella sp.]
MMSKATAVLPNTSCTLPFPWKRSPGMKRRGRSSTAPSAVGTPSATSRSTPPGFHRSPLSPR